MSVRITSEDREQILDLDLDGNAVRDIAEETGWSVGAVHGIVRASASKARWQASQRQPCHRQPTAVPCVIAERA